MTKFKTTFKQGEVVDLAVSVNGAPAVAFAGTLTTYSSPTLGETDFTESVANAGRASVLVDAGYSVPNGHELRVYVDTAVIEDPVEVVPGVGVNVVIPGSTWEGSAIYSGGTVVYGVLYLIRLVDEAIIDLLDLGNFQVVSSGGSTEITQTQTYVFSDRPLTDGEYRWFWRHRNSGAVVSKYSHVDGVNVGRQSLVNGNPVSSDWQQVTAGDVLQVIDTVTVKGSPEISETFLSPIVTAQAAPVPPALTTEHVTLSTYASPNGTELNLSFTTYPNTGEVPPEDLANQEIEDPRTISHIEVSTNSTDGVNGSWDRIDGYGKLGDWPVIVPAEHAGKVWLRFVNRMNVAGPALDYPSPPVPTIGAPVVSLTCVRASSLPGPAPFIFMADARGFGVARPKHDLHYQMTHPSESRTLGRKAAEIAGKDYESWSNTDDTKTVGIIGGCVIDPDLIDFAGAPSVVRQSSCTITNHEDGTSAVATCDVTVLDPDQFFAGADTICVGDGSDWSGAPAGATQVTSRAALMSELSTRSTNVRILYQRGVDHNEDTGFDLINNMSGLIYVGAFGSGTPPIVRRGFQFGNNTPGSEVVWGIDWIGPYDATDPYSLADRPPDCLDFVGGHSETSIQCVWDCYFYGWSKPMDFSDFTFGQLVAGNLITSWQDYGTQQGDGGQMAFIGNVVQQPSETVISTAGPDGSKAWSTQKTSWHGPRRVSRAHLFLAFIDEVLGPNGNWANAPGIQPPIRALRGNNRGILLVCSGTIVDGGFFELGSGEDYHPHGGNDLVVDNCYIHGITDASATYGIQFCGATFRNCFFVAANVPKYSGSGPVGSNKAMIIQQVPYIWVSDLLTLKTRLIFCTLHDARNTANRTKGGTVQNYLPTLSKTSEAWMPQPLFEFIDCAHVAPDAPGADGGVTLDTGMNFTDFTYSSQFNGWHIAPPMADSNDVPSVSYYPEYAAPTIGLPRAQVGSSVYQTASTTTYCRFDFRGQLRGATPSRGALEPA